MSQHRSANSAHAAKHQRPPFWRDERVLQVLTQVVFLAGVAVVGVWLFSNYTVQLEEKNLLFSFDFLQQEASFDLSEGPQFSATDLYLRAFFVGVVNTFRVAIIGIVLATLVGLVVGVARLSGNWLISKIAGVYVEFFRNTPLLVQLFFWYFAVILKLPRLGSQGEVTAITLPGPIYLSNRGMALPWPRSSEAFDAWLPYLLAATVAAVILLILRRRGMQRTGRPSFNFLWVLAAFAVIAAAGWLLISGHPLYMDRPAITGEKVLRIEGGTFLSPEYAALLFGLVVYTGAFIAEVVRAGIMAVPHGQTEAARSQGLSEMQILRLIILPQAMRIIIPPLISQYLNLTKNSSLAIAIAFLDVYAVSNTMLNQSGRVVEVFLMLMAVYLSMSLAISLIMNAVNRRMQIVER
ncbi:MAG: ABC transporter permease subunit [Anaerolineae bacterium]|jgi:general L-amino acid transport system permease protein